MNNQPQTNLVEYYNGKTVIVFLKNGHIKTGFITGETQNFLTLYSTKENRDISLPIIDIEDICEYNNRGRAR